jgi:HEAT repeat protein
MTPTPPSTAKTTLEQIKRAYPRSNVGPTEITVPGVELFALSSDQPVVLDKENLPTIVAIAGGVGSPILEGRDVTRAVIKATKDPEVLARVAMAVEQQGGELLTAPKNDEQKRLNVGPPAVNGNAVTFWIWTSGVGRMLRYAKLDLATGELAFPPEPGARDERIPRAIEGLASTSLSLQDRAIETLAAACATNEAAKAALLDAAAHHKREDTRAGAVDASPACGAAAIDTLVQILEHDASSKVRWKAAKALGKIGDAKARPALEKAAKSSDSDVKAEATEALEKLK